MINNQKFNIAKKVPLFSLLEILTDLYEEGVNFIDISGENISSVKDIIHIDIQPNYIDEKYESEEVTNEEIKVTKLSDDNLNDLI